MSDAIQPGEIDLESAATETAAADTATETAVDTAAEATDTADPGDTAETVTTEEPAAPLKRQPSGAVAELIALRQEKKQLAARLQQFESSPVLQRLTPEIQQAILDGRVSIAPPQASREAEQERLKSVAETLQLYKVDAGGNTIPDLDAAKRVSSFVRSEVQAEVAPVRHLTLSEKANDNVTRAVAYAEANGLDVDIVKDEFLTILAQPNGAEMLSQQKIARQVWRGAVGRMHEEGKLTKAEKKAAAAGPTEKAPAAIITEPTGRRASASQGIQLSPALQRVYAEHGLTPGKAFTATKTVNFNGPIDLED